MVVKDEVVEWFKTLSGAGRLDTMCTLLDLCLPFEIRFLGTVMENLGRRDFHELSHASHRANGFLSTRTAIISKAALRSALMDSPVQHPNASPSVNTNFSASTPAPAHASSSSPATGVDSVIPTSRPSSVPLTETVHRKSTLTSSSSQHQNLNESPFFALRSQDDAGVETGSKSSIMQNPVNPQDLQDDKIEKSVLLDDILRRRLTLYLALLTATNRECANAYYKVLADIQPLLDTVGWIESLKEDMLEEMALLFTIGSNHPAFAFEQRHYLGEVATRFIAHLEEVQNKAETQKLYAAPLPFFSGYDKFPHCYMYFPAPIQAVQWATPAGAGNISGSANGTVEEVRLQSPITYAVPPIAPFPLLVHAPPRSQLQHPQVPHQYSQNVPLQSPVAPQNQINIGAQSHSSPLVPHAYQQNPAVGTASSSHTQIYIQNPTQSYTPTINGAAQIPIVSPIHSVGLAAFNGLQATGSQFQPKTSNLSQSQLSPQPSVVGTARNTTVASGAYSSQPNSVDGYESEEYYESTEDSPYASPPQSLTPSRSQSPTPSSQPAANVNHNFAITQPVVSHSSPDLSNAAVYVPPQAIFNSPSQRSVCSNATSISPPPRTQRTSDSRKLSQNVQVQSRVLPKNAQNSEASLQYCSNLSSPFPNVPVSNSTATCVSKSQSCGVGSTNVIVNGAVKSSSNDRRTIIKTNPSSVTKIASSNSIASTVVPVNSGTIASGAPAMTSSNCTISGPNLVAASTNSGQRDSMRRQNASNRRQPPNSTQNSMQQMHHTVSSQQNIFSVHPHKSTTIQQTPIMGQPFGMFSVPSVSSQLPFVSHPSLVQKGNMPSFVGMSSHGNLGKTTTSQASLNGGKIIASNETAAPAGNLTNSTSLHNGIKPSAIEFTSPVNVPTDIASNPLLHTTSCVQLPATSHHMPSNPTRSNNGLVLEVKSGGPEFRIDPSTPSFGDVEGIVGNMNRPQLSCYNCGSQSHLGPDCNEKTMEEMTKNIYRINFQPDTPATEAKEKE